CSLSEKPAWSAPMAMVAIRAPYRLWPPASSAPISRGDAPAEPETSGNGRGARGRESEGLQRGAVGAGRHESLEVQARLDRPDLVQRRARGGLPRGEQRAAVGVWLDRGLERPDQLRRRLYLYCCHAAHLV